VDPFGAGQPPDRPSTVAGLQSAKSGVGRFSKSKEKGKRPPTRLGAFRFALGGEHTLAPLWAIASELARLRALKARCGAQGRLEPEQSLNTTRLRAAPRLLLPVRLLSGTRTVRLQNGFTGQA
jgi:hypothetical protein